MDKNPFKSTIFLTIQIVILTLASVLYFQVSNLEIRNLKKENSDLDADYRKLEQKYLSSIVIHISKDKYIAVFNKELLRLITNDKELLCKNNMVRLAMWNGEKKTTYAISGFSRNHFCFMIPNKDVDNKSRCIIETYNKDIKAWFPIPTS